MSQLLTVIQSDQEEVERVCRSIACKNRFYSLESSRGGRVKEYCSDACKKQASRKGKAYSAHSKAQHLQEESRKLCIEANRLMRQAEELMRQSDICIYVGQIAIREAQYDADKQLKENQL